MPEGGDHYMAIIVGKDVHDHETLCSPKKNFVFFVLPGLRQRTENTISRFILNHVFHPPWRPKVFHLVLFLSGKMNAFAKRTMYPEKFTLKFAANARE